MYVRNREIPVAEALDSQIEVQKTLQEQLEVYLSRKRLLLEYH
jgi:hypothetical protein